MSEEAELAIVVVATVRVEMNWNIKPADAPFINKN